jgi:CPA2 family monovalent cation:H+ antiporter-2
LEHHASVTSLVIVMLVAFLTPILLHRFKLSFMPVVVAEIIVGLIIGKSGLNLVEEDMWIETLSTLGFIFLMFLSGLEIDFSAFKTNKKQKDPKSEPNTFVVATLVFAGIFVVSLGLSYLFVLAGFIENAFLMTLIISTISLGVVVPTLKEANLIKTSIGQIILLVAVIADLATMILLAVFVSLNGGDGGNTWFLLLLFGAGIMLYFLGRFFQNHRLIEKLSEGTVQIGTRAIFALIIVLVALSESVGAENILGAFLAGVLVSLLSPNPEMVHKLDSFGYGFLIPIFFVMVGVNLNVWELFGDPKMLLLIPLLFLALLLSKLLPVLILKKWYDYKTIFASGFLLTSTLSLVIAAATIGERIGIITPEMRSTLILVAVISCVITPVVFKKLFPKSASEDKRLRVNIVGANQLTLPIPININSKHYQVTLFSTRQEKTNLNLSESLFEILELEEYNVENFEKVHLFDGDIVVFATGDETVNTEFATIAKEKGVERVIARVESLSLENMLKKSGVEVFSVLFSNQALLQALIELPHILEILTNRETGLYEVEILNPHYESMSIRKFPFTGDVIFVRIFRGNESIVPHGDTELQLHDRLILTGSIEYVNELKKELELSSI